MQVAIIFGGGPPLPWLLVALLAGGAVSFGLCFAADAFLRRQVLAAAARRAGGGR